MRPQHARIGKQNQTAIGTLVERQTGYTMLLHLPDGYKPEQVRDALAALRAIRGNDLVFTLSRTDGLNAAIAQLAGLKGARLPIWSTAVVDDEGIEIWGGPPRQPHLLVQVHWSQIQLIQEGEVRQAGTRQIGFVLNAAFVLPVRNRLAGPGTAAQRG